MREKKAPVSLKDLVYRGIIEQICSGELSPDAVITEKQMIETFGVSKSPVREALIQLCAENVLKSMPRFGYQVIQLTEKDIHDLTELRLYLELSSLTKVIEYITPAELAELRLQNERRQQQKESKTVWTAWNNNRDFHLLLVSCARNAQVTAAVDRAMNTYRRAYALAYTSQQEAVATIHSGNLHDVIVNALAQSDLTTARDALERDIKTLESSCLRGVTENNGGIFHV